MPVALREPWLQLELVRWRPSHPRLIMTSASILDGKLVVEVRGWDKLWSLTSRLEIPLEHVVDIRPTDAGDEGAGFRALGTYVPGVITAGTFLQEGSWVFWDVHDLTKAITVDLRDERYSKLIIEVPDAAATIGALKHALFRRDFQRT